MSTKLDSADFMTHFTRQPIKMSTINKNQYLSITDIISEGPIEGLTRGSGSIYLDNAPAGDGTQAGHSLSNGAAIFTLDGTVDVTTANASLDNHTTSPTAGTKFLQILDFVTQTGADAIKENTTPAQIKITAASAFFEDWMVKDITAATRTNPFIELSIDSVRYFVGTIIKKNSNTEAIAVPAGTFHPKFEDKTSGEYKIHIHGSAEISTILDNDVTLASATNVPTGNYNCNISDTRYKSDFVSGVAISDTSKHKGFSYQFRTGSFYQTPIDDIYQGSGATSITTAPGVAFEHEDSGTNWPSVVGQNANRIERTAAQLNLSTATARQVDSIAVMISYPSGLIVRNEKGTELYQGLQAYLIEISVDRGDGAGLGAYTNINEDGEFYYHVAETSSNFFVQEDISLERFKPFSTFKLRFTKATRDDQNPRSDTTYDDDNNVQLSSTLQSITCIIRERLTYPYTAYANIRVNAESFNNIPKRSYLCRGRKLLVPSNYITREESGGAANYKRNVSTGATESTEQDWDGRMRDILVYTDNPAWVFYDMLVHTRYGLGNWLKLEDIDKYALYRIAKYCDEEVPDGKGETEPRFTANIYLSKKAETYKVLKDMATTFRAILYWSEGSIVPVTDMAKEPVYNFTKGNVMGGAFKYESTGSKRRSNQIGVTWNNPENDYIPEVLLVEDRENIVKTGKIITEEAVAFGATSIGQATRYGRWKLWTAINQSEVVSFKTAINAAFLAPGDIINIQDADRYDIIYSGRVYNTQNESEDPAVTVKLDRTITLAVGSTYELSVIMDGSVAYLAQDAATISGTNYERGDILATSLYTNEETASNIQDTSGNIVQISWSPHNHVETKTVSTSAGSVDTLTVTGGFSTSPLKEAIWLLKETRDALTVAGSKKLYKILSLKEAGKNDFDIQAVEHYNEKFDAVDKDFGRPYVDTLLTPSIVVPAPTNLTVTIS